MILGAAVGTQSLKSVVSASVSADSMAALGIAGEGDGCVVADHDGRPVAPMFETDGAEAGP